MNSRDRERREARVKAARQRAEEAEASLFQLQESIGDDQASQQPATPSEYGIRLFEDLYRLEKINDVMLLIRVSTRNQRPHLPYLERGARQELDVLGVNVVAAFGVEREESGKTLAHEERHALFEARDAALERNLPLVTPCFSRFVRHPGFDLRRFPDLRATVAQVQDLIRA
jgi:hypothetical protein